MTGGADEAAPDWRADDKRSDDDAGPDWREDDAASAREWRGTAADAAGLGQPDAEPTVPDITVELESRRPIFLESTLAGVAAGLCFPLVLALGASSAAAVGFPVAVDASTAPTVWAFHLVFATVLGSVFGLLVDSRPFWMYGRGFLGPAVGVAFGAVLWVGVDVVAWPLLVSVLAIPVDLGAAAALGVALGSYLAYGALVGTFLNLFALARV